MSLMDFDTYDSPIPVFILLDTSHSMMGENEILLNTSVSTILTALKEAEDDNECLVKVCITEFNKDAQWLIGCTQEGEYIEDASSSWCSLSPTPNEANLAAAIHLVNECMHVKYLGARFYYPLVILVSGSTSWSANPNEAIQTLRESLRSKYFPDRERVIRISIGLPSADIAKLEAFASLGNVSDEECNTPLVFYVDHEKASEQRLKRVIHYVVRGIAFRKRSPIEIPDDTEWEDEWVDEWED